MSETPRKNAPGTRGRPFQLGNKGKPPGARNRATRALEALMGKSAKDVATAVIDAAKKGDVSAARLVLERVLPARKDSPIAIELPELTDPASMLAAGNTVLAAVARGDITPAEADAVMGLLEKQRRLIETTELESRITQLEQEVGNGSS